VRRAYARKRVHTELLSKALCMKKRQVYVRAELAAGLTKAQLCNEAVERSIPVCIYKGIIS
jgi:hypothetical protein